MNKRMKYYGAIWLISLALFNLIAFTVPAAEKYTASFWTAYAAVTLAFVAQLACAMYALKEKNGRKLFYRLPVISVSYTGLTVMLIAGALCMAIPMLPYMAAVIVCVLVAAVTAISLTKASAAADEAEKLDDKVRAQTAFIKMLTVDAESLMARAINDAVKAECKKVYEAVRYSDPMSDSALESVERQIDTAFDEFTNAVCLGSDSISAVADGLVILINDRNKKCKALK